MNQPQNTQTPLSEEIRQKVLTYLGIERAPQEKQDEVLIKIGEVAFQKIVFAVLERLDEDAQNKYDKLLATDPQPEAIETFFKEHIPDYAEMTQQIVDELMKELASAGNNAAKGVE